MSLAVGYWLGLVGFIVFMAIFIVVACKHPNIFRAPEDRPVHDPNELNDPIMRRAIQLRDRIVSEHPRVYNMGGGWGDAINWEILDQEVVGWQQYRPAPGDLLRCRMKSGRIGLYVFTDVEYCRNPLDMFYGKVSLISYADSVYGEWILARVQNKPVGGFVVL